MNRDGRPSTRLHPSRRELVAIDWSAAEQAHTGVTEAERAYRDACAERDAAFLRLHQSGLPYRVIASHFRIGHDRVVIAANRAKDKAAA